MNKSREFQKFIKKYRCQHIYVGFSGGADSTLLLLKLLDLKKEFTDLNITAVHFHHGLRKNADNEAIWCQNFCLKNNIDFKLYYLNAPEYLNGKRNIEAVCRELRLKKYSEIIRDENAVVMLGHHQNDRYENLLMRIFRGGNVGSITSLRSEQFLNGMLFIRPLLNYKRSEIINELLNVYDVKDFCRDESNDDDKFLRNFLRNNFLKDLFDKFPHADKGIEHSLRCLEEDALFIENLAKEQYEKLIKKYDMPNLAVNIPVDDFILMPSALRFRVLKRFLNEKTSGRFFCDYNFFQRFNKMLKKMQLNANGEAKYLELINNVFRLKFQNNFMVVENYSYPSNLKDLQCCEFNIFESVGDNNFNEFGQFEVKIFDKKVDTDFNQQLANAFNNKNSHLLFLDADKLPSVLKLRHWQNGDYIVPFGKKSSTHLKIKKIFTDKKIPKVQRHLIPLLTTINDEVLWVVGVRVSAKFAVSDTTKKLILVKYCH